MVLANKHKNRFGIWWHDESMQVHIKLEASKVLKHFALNGTVISKGKALGPACIVVIPCYRLGKEILSQGNRN